MSLPLVPVASLLVSNSLMMIGAGLTGILLPVRGTLEGWTPFQVGLLGTGYSVAFIVGCLVAPRIVRRAGHVRTFSSLAALLAIAALLYFLFVHPVVWVMFRGLTGFALAGSFMVIESWLNERVTNTTRGLILSAYMISNTGAMLVGQAILPIADPMQAAPFILCAIFFAASIIPNALSRQPHPKPLTQVGIDPRSILRSSPSALSGALTAGIMTGGWIFMAPVFARDIGFSTSQVAILLAATMFGAALFQYPLGRLSDRIDRRLVLVGCGAVGLAVSLGAYVFASADPLVLYVVAIVIGGIMYPVYSLAIAHANDFADTSDFLQIAGSLLLVYSLGEVIGPLLVAVLIENVGAHAIFLAITGASAALVAHASYRIVRSPPVPAELREDFANLPLGLTPTPETLALDPRANAEPDAR